MATWCFDKDEANKCCSSAVYGSCYRSLTYSFGSICLGSLLQALVSTLRVVIETARNQREQNDSGGCGNVVLCILDCIASMLEDVIEYFNQWAYVFVGVYGYSYLESGRRVVELFRARGWTSIITNNLVGYVLGFTNVIIAIATGFVAVVLQGMATHHHLSGGELVGSYVYGPVSGYVYYAFG
jgi:Plasma-membrane choline transporter